MTVYGDGSQTRSFCYVDDMIDGLLALLESGVDTSVNIGNPVQRSILELAKLVIGVVGSDSGITYEPLPPQDPQVRRPDLTKATTKVGWEPEIGLRDGLAQSLGYFDQRV